MSAPNALITDAAGLQTQPNELTLPQGSLAVCENMEITRDGVIEVARGHEDFSTNLPDFRPSQLLVVGGVAYLNLDSGLWYYDTTSGNWLRKTGRTGAKSTNPIWCCYQNGFIYYTANNVVVSIDTTTGKVAVIAGRFGVGGAVTDGTGDAARFISPLGIVGDGTNLYVCDTNRIRQVAPPLTSGAGVVTTIAGSATASSVDGTGTAATFNGPVGLCFDGTNLFVTDQNGCRIRKIAPPFTAAGAVVTTIAGSSSGTTDGTGPAGKFTAPAGICTDGTNLYVSDGALSNSRVRKVAPPLLANLGIVTTLANTGTTGVQGLTCDGTNLYLSDNAANLVRKIAPPLVAGSATMTTFAGSGSAGSADGIGTAAQFNGNYGLFWDGAAILACDYNNNAIRKIYPNAYVTTISGVPGSPAPSFGSGLADGMIMGPP